MTKHNIEGYNSHNELNKCPRCCSDNVHVRKRRVNSINVSEILCKDCGHTISGSNAQYLNNRWNTNRIDLVEYTIKLLRVNPYTAYVSDYTVNTWYNTNKLCSYLGRRLGVKVVARRPKRFDGGGYILEAMYE